MFRGVDTVEVSTRSQINWYNDSSCDRLPWCFPVLYSRAWKLVMGRTESRFITKLTAKQVEKLEQTRDYDESKRARQRAHAILLSIGQRITVAFPALLCSSILAEGHRKRFAVFVSFLLSRFVRFHKIGE